jgi:hypothetical protein
MSGVQPSVFAVGMAEFVKALLAEPGPTFIGNYDVPSRWRRKRNRSSSLKVLATMVREPAVTRNGID